MDGQNLDSGSYFESKSPYCMDFYADSLVVSEVSNILLYIILMMVERPGRKLPGHQ